MTHKIALIVGGVWLVLALVAWVTVVPAVMSVSTFLWANLAALGLAVALPAILRAGQPSRSMGGILYDAEHPEKRR
jgi:hypothetical protein